MILHVGERVYWGAPEVIYLEGKITSLNPQKQLAVVQVERTTQYSAHLIGTKVPFAANGIKPLAGDSPPGTTDQRSTQRQPPPLLSDDEKVKSVAAVAVHEQFGYYTLTKEREKILIEQVTQVLNNDPTIRARIIVSMDEIFKRKW